MHQRELPEGARVKERRPPEPAPLPLHALLRMQQTAGNQAVGRVLARKPLFKPSEVKKLVANAIADGARTEKDILLAIYNEMRLAIDPTPKAFTDPEAAVEPLTVGRQMNGEDHELFTQEAAAKAPHQSKKKEKAPKTDKGAAGEKHKKQVETDRGEILGKFGPHVLKGGFREDDRPSGFHTINGGSATHEAFGKKTTGENATYRQSVREIDDRKNVKETQSTFFPDAATADEIIDAMTNVFGATAEKGRRTVAYPDKLKGLPLTSLGMSGKSKEPTIFPATFVGGDPGEGYDPSHKPKKH
jgi:hypothetical protein